MTAKGNGGRDVARVVLDAGAGWQAEEPGGLDWRQETGFRGQGTGGRLRCVAGCGQGRRHHLAPGPRPGEPRGSPALPVLSPDRCRKSCTTTPSTFPSSETLFSSWSPPSSTTRATSPPSGTSPAWMPSWPRRGLLQASIHQQGLTGCLGHRGRSLRSLGQSGGTGSACVDGPEVPTWESSSLCCCLARGAGLGVSPPAVPLEGSGLKSR